MQGAQIGRYVVLGKLGSGGMGAVYAAHDPDLDRNVAIKLLRDRISPQSSKRLAREARALARLSHPNVVQVYDAGLHEGQVFVAMELVEGQDLKKWCQSDPAPGWRQILRAYLEAARGLAAAHDKRMIHRDIKPANLLIGSDGRVRVADFGLAAAAQSTLYSESTVEDETSASRGGDASASGTSSASQLVELSSLKGRLDDRLTQTGTLLGTIAYMAPEQHRAEEVGPAADQYSFCVSLFSALYRCLPFPTPERRHLPHSWLKQKLTGHVIQPNDTDVPAWLYKVLVRGMAPSPHERYPTMAALIEALGRDPQARRRARLRLGAYMAIAAVAAAALTITSSQLLGEDNAAVCQGFAHGLGAVWNDDERARIYASFTERELPYAADTAARVSMAIDTYASSWQNMRVETCTATKVDETQSADIMYLRVACLDRRRDQLGALVDLFSTKADDDVVANAIATTHSLLPIDYCADLGALRAAIPPPENPRVRARVADLQPDVDRLAILYQAGTYREGIARGEALSADVDALDYPPMRAETRYWLGMLRRAAGTFEAAEADFRAAIHSAAHAGDDVLLAKAWAGLIDTIGWDQARSQEASMLIETLSTAAIRARDEETRAKALSSIAQVYHRMANYEESHNHFAEALAIREHIYGPDHLALAPILGGMANMLMEKGEFDQARALHERVVAIRERALGPEHPDLGRAYNNLAALFTDTGDYRQALVYHKRTLAILEKGLGPEHPRVGTSLNNMAVALGELGQHERAIEIHRRAVHVREQSVGPDHPGVGISLTNLAGLLRLVGRYEESRIAYERAIDIFRTAMGPDHPNLMYPLSGLARTLFAAGHTDAAEPIARRALEVFENANGPNHPRLTRPLVVLADLYLARDEPKTSMRFLQRAATIDNPSATGEIKAALAKALWAEGKGRHRALDLAREAIEYYSSVGNSRAAATVGQWLASRAPE